MTTEREQPETIAANSMRTFDLTPDGREILFDRQRQNSGLVLIDLPPE